jgi:hypothetical protein
MADDLVAKVAATAERLLKLAGSYQGAEPTLEWALRKALGEAGAVIEPGWRPADQAPKRERFIAIANFMAHDGNWRWVKPTIVDGKFDGWDYEYPSRPTHFRPLPAPPKPTD